MAGAELAAREQAQQHAPHALPHCLRALDRLRDCLACAACAWEAQPPQAGIGAGMRGEPLLAAHFQACNAKLAAEAAGAGRQGLPRSLSLDGNAVRVRVPAGSGLVEVVVAFLSPEQYPEGPVLLSCEGEPCQLACPALQPSARSPARPAWQRLSSHRHRPAQGTPPSARRCRRCHLFTRTAATCSRCWGTLAGRSGQVRPAPAGSSCTSQPSAQLCATWTGR